jgi:hypothetical protein
MKDDLINIQDYQSEYLSLILDKYYTGNSVNHYEHLYNAVYAMRRTYKELENQLNTINYFQNQAEDSILSSIYSIRKNIKKELDIVNMDMFLVFVLTKKPEIYTEFETAKILKLLKE